MSSKETKESIWRNFVELLMIVGMALVLKTSVVEAYKIPSASMEDTLLVGDFLTANKFIYGAHLPLTDYRLPAIRDPRAGDVVIFRYPVDRETRYIKRCVAVGGDTVLVRNKQLYVNGVPFKNPAYSKFLDTLRNGDQHIQPRRAGGQNSRDNYGPYVVPTGHYFMMGDNRDNSSDSRYWGPVPNELILGQAMFRHWSWDDSLYPSPDVSISDPLSIPRMFLHNGIRFFEKVRWSRLFGGIS